MALYIYVEMYIRDVHFRARNVKELHLQYTRSWHDSYFLVLSIKKSASSLALSLKLLRHIIYA